MSDQNADRTSTIRIVRVFLASPSDLGDERRIARDAVEEINRTVARPAGFHVDLIGWEDTLSSAGRPQALINEDLETCQMFIGMLWARWGTPPDTEGKFSSGFEEEFTLACKRNEDNGEPHITLFFKEVEASKIQDPGPELSKVLNFKYGIISQKKILYEEFSDVIGFGQKVRIIIANFIHKLNRASQSRLGENSPDESPISSRQVGPPEHVETPIDNIHAVEAKFLAAVSRTLGKEGESPSAFQLARLRNIAAAYGVSENDDITVGAHDANLIY